MMVHRKGGTGPYRFRVRAKGRKAATLSTGRYDETEAKLVKAMVKQWRKDRRWAWLALVVNKAVKLADAYDAHCAGTLAELMDEAQATANDLDLSPLVAAWAKAGANPTYVRQVRALIPAGARFGASQFRRKTIKTFLERLDVSNVTKRKYLSALSMFARWLMEHEHLDANPTRDLTLGEKERPEKAASALTPDEAERVIRSYPRGEQRAIEATMMGSMAEWQAVDRLHRRDIDPKRRLIHAHGTKTARHGDYRNRWIEVTEDYCWDILWEWAKDMHPDQKLFQVSESVALRRHQKQCRELGLTETTLHQYRHTFAKMWIDRGAAGGLREDRRDMPWLRNQAGHSPKSTLIETTYGVIIRRFKLEAITEGVTKSVTPLRRGMK